MLKVTMITITYNSADTIEKTITSVLEQKYPDLEYIIVDGGSTDDTLKIVRKYQKRITKLISEKDKGISDAFNKGIQQATGDVIGIINSDDALYEGTLVKVSEQFEKHKDLDVLYGNTMLTDKDMIDIHIARPDTDLKKLRYSFSIWHPSVFVAKKTYLKYGLFSCDYKYAMDYELLSRIYFGGGRFQYIDECLSYFRDGGVSQRRYDRTLKEHKKIAKRNGCSEWLIDYHICILYMIWSVRRLFGRRA